MTIMISFHIAFMISIITITKSQNFALYPLQLPYKMHSHAAGIYNNTLTVINGIDDATEPIDSSFSVILSPTSTPWSEHEVEMPLDTTAILIEGDSTIQIDRLLYIFNPNTLGNDAIRYKIMLVYDLSSHEYIQSEIPLFRTAFPCTVYNANHHIIYIIGGIDITAAFPVPGIPYTQTYTISTNQWDVVHDINIARGYAGCAMDATHEYIFLFGGAKSVDDLRNRNALRSIERYSVLDDEWNVLQQTMKTGKGNIKCSLLPINQKIYCSSQWMEDTKWEVFDPTDFSTRTIDINIPRILFSLSLWGDTCLMVAGGAEINRGMMIYFDSTEYLGQCPPPILEPPIIAPTHKPTGDPTLRPTRHPTATPTRVTTLRPSNAPTQYPTSYVVSQCFIGANCRRPPHCCPSHIHSTDRVASGVTCAWRGRVCCLEIGHAGCYANSDCCGGHNVCVDNVCSKDKFEERTASMLRRSSRGGNDLRGNSAQRLVINGRQTETANSMDLVLVHHIWILPGFCVLCVVLLIIAWCGVIKTESEETTQSSS